MLESCPMASTRPRTWPWDAGCRTSGICRGAVRVRGPGRGRACHAADTFKPLDAPHAIEVAARSRRTCRNYALRTTMRMFAALAASLVFTFTYRAAGRQKPARRAGDDPAARHPAIGADPGLPVVHHRVLHEPVPRQRAGLELAAIFAIFTSQAWNMAFSFYQSLTTVPADLDEVDAQLPPDRLAAVLAAGSAVRHAGPGLEHDAVDVRRLVLRGRVARRSRSATTPGRCPASAPTSPLALEQARHRRGVLGDRRDAGGDPAVRPAAVPPAGRLVGEVPLRDDRRRRPPRIRGC